MDETPTKRRSRLQYEAKKRWLAKKDAAWWAARSQSRREERAAKNALLPTPPRRGRPPGRDGLPAPGARQLSRTGYVLSVAADGMACVIFSSSEIMSARTDGLPPVGAGDIVRVTPGQIPGEIPFCRFAGGEQLSAIKEWTAVMDAAYRYQHGGECPSQYRFVLARMFSSVSPSDRKCLREAAKLRLQEQEHQGQEN